jgi:hypothetical protein
MMTDLQLIGHIGMACSKAAYYVQHAWRAVIHRLSRDVGELQIVGDKDRMPMNFRKTVSRIPDLQRSIVRAS